jgi:hypothetical protein
VRKPRQSSRRRLAARRPAPHGSRGERRRRPRQAEPLPKLAHAAQFEAECRRLVRLGPRGGWASRQLSLVADPGGENGCSFARKPQCIWSAWPPGATVPGASEAVATKIRATSNCHYRIGVGGSGFRPARFRPAAQAASGMACAVSAASAPRGSGWRTSGSAARCHPATVRRSVIQAAAPGMIGSQQANPR